MDPARGTQAPALSPGPRPATSSAIDGVSPEIGAPHDAPRVTPRGRRRRLLAALILMFLIGDELLVLALRGQDSALQLVNRDTTGAAFEAPPDDLLRAHPAGFRFDYAMGMDSLRAARVGAPPATGADGGLDDVRRDIRWVRARLRAGEGYPAAHWRLEETVAAAADSGRRFSCVSYSCAMVSLAESQGYPARLVHLGRHITSEVYLPAWHRWVFADALYDFIPYGTEGDPLSLLETHRRLVDGRSVEWRSVVGDRGDDDSLDGPGRHRIETFVRSGDFIIPDGALVFGLIGDLRRLWDVATGRPRVVQLALRGQPAIDREERRLRAGLALWNLLALLVLGACTVAGRSRGPLEKAPRPAPSSAPAAEESAPSGIGGGP